VDNLIPINITGAKVTSMFFRFGDELKWQAEVGLIMENEEQITSIQVGNDCWDKNRQAQLPIRGYELAGMLQKEVETAVTMQLNSLNKTLEHKET